MNKRERGNWDILLKRRDWLEARIGDAERSGKDLSYDKHELGALMWLMDEYNRLSNGPERSRNVKGKEDVS